MATNKDIDTLQSQSLVLMLQVKEGVMTIEQAIAMHVATMDEAIVERVEKKLGELRQ